MKIHYTHPYLIQPVHPITIDLIGLGGTGSQVLNNLGRMNAALKGLGHPGLHVRAWDADVVTTANMGRQLFSEADLSHNKATVLITRVNRFFGTEWQSMPVKYNGDKTSNILITCVDSAKERIRIGRKVTKRKPKQPTDILIYWLDIGNLQKTGQCVLGTNGRVWTNAKEKPTGQKLKTVVQLFPKLKSIKEEKQGPSCSLAEALEKQDLFINSTLAQFGCNLLWKLIKEGELKYHGCYVNLESMIVNPIKIK